MGYKPDRVGAKYVKNMSGNAQPSKVTGKTPPRKAATKGNAGDSSMAQPNNKPSRHGATAVGKEAYKRSHVGVTPTGLPMKRQPEGSVLTGGSISSGAVQPFSRGKVQKLSKKMKGAD